MNWNDLHTKIIILTKLNIKNVDLANALGIDKANITYKKKQNKEVTLSEMVRIAEHFNLSMEQLEDDAQNVTEQKEEPIYTDNPECTCRNCETCTKCFKCGKNRDKVEIHYWEQCNETWKHPKLSSLNFDREMVEDIWCRNPENLRIVAMTGDKMDGGAYPFKNMDILLIDLSENSVEKTGAFLFTTRGGEGIYICNLDQKLNGDVVFSHNNPLFEETRYTKEQLRELDFKVIGRVFKNESYNL